MALVGALRGSTSIAARLPLLSRHCVCLYHNKIPQAKPARESAFGHGNNTGGRFPSGPGTLDGAGGGSQPNTPSKAKLTEEINAYVHHHRQSSSFFQHKYEAVMALEEVAQRFRPQYSAFITGSSMNGVGTNSSDTDITLLNRKDRTPLSRPEAINFLEQLQQVYEESGGYTDIKLVAAKVPLLTITDEKRDVPFDISLDGTSAVRNTYMLQLYSACDYRIVPLIMVVKDWAKKQGIKSAHEGLLSSYGISLMVLNFLQVQQPWVAPVLHHTMKEELYLDVLEMQNKREHDLPATPTSSNTASLGELLCGFFHYYAAFQFDSYIIQVSEGRTVHGQDSINPSFSAGSLNKAYVKIEEPFSKNNVSHAILKRSQFMRLRTEFVVADDALFYDSNPSLATIGLELPKPA